MTPFSIFIGVCVAVAVLFVVSFSIVMLLSIAWTHYPQGIIKALRDKKRRRRDE